MTAQCLGWLAADYLARAGFTITDTPGGRVAARDGLPARPIGPACTHPDCQVPLGAPMPARVPDDLSGLPL